MSAKRALSLGLLAWACYIAVRSLLQQCLPFHDWPSFIPQDLAISVFRVSCGFACLWIARQRWYDSALGIGPAAALPWLGWLAVAVFVGAELTAVMSQRPDWQQPWWIRAVEVAIALAVAFNEEVGFRALAYSGLRELWGRKAAIFVSTLLFTLMHVGYQPWFHLPKIFFVGLFFALLRDRGASLKFLIMLHFVADSIYAVTLAGQLENWQLYQTAAGLSAGAALLAWLSPARHSSQGEALLFVDDSLKPGAPEAQVLGVEKHCDLVERASVEGKPIQGSLLKLRDREFLGILDAYEGDDTLRDKALIQTKNGRQSEAWIYVASKI